MMHNSNFQANKEEGHNQRMIKLPIENGTLVLAF